MLHAPQATSTVGINFSRMPRASTDSAIILSEIPCAHPGQKEVPGYVRLSGFLSIITDSSLSSKLAGSLYNKLRIRNVKESAVRVYRVMAVGREFKVIDHLTEYVHFNAYEALKIWG